jgi:hypothetical protein
MDSSDSPHRVLGAQPISIRFTINDETEWTQYHRFMRVLAEAAVMQCLNCGAPREASCEACPHCDCLYPIG